MYRVLYRKWRPKSFFDVVGQEHITVTLKNEIMTSKISHAYLFTGSRGTGKTTCAKIFAKAVNCLHPKDGEPCNECEICRGIDDGTVLDVEEIDAASNNGVDNIREIRDEVNFAPAKAKYRVYIIDEVHMLSSGAFNALLKTLEEPPAHVIFILATTEVHKLPATILSRCQRFDFRRIPTESIAGRLKFVAKNEGIDIDDEAAVLISRIADGGMRDALSLLDRCNDGGRVTEERASQILGLASKSALFNISSALCSGNLAACLKTVTALCDASSDVSRVAEQLILHFRNLMIAKSVKNPAELIVCPKEELVRYMNAADGFSMERILQILDALLQCGEKMRTASNKRVELEMTFVSLCAEPLPERKAAPVLPQKNSTENLKKAEPDPIFEETKKEHKEQKEQADGIFFAEEAADKYRFTDEDAPPWEEPGEKVEIPEKASHMPPERPTEPKAPEITEERRPAPPAFDAALAQKSAESAPTAPDGVVRFDKWPEVLVALSDINRMMSATLRGSSAYLKGENLLLIKSGNPMFFELIRKESKNKNDIRSALMKVTGKQFRLGPYEAAEKAKADPMKAFLDEMKAKGVDVVES